jgi:hypothetical protein
LRQQLEIALDDRKMNHPKIVDCQLLISRRDRTAFLQPADTTLNHISLTIARPVITDWTPTPALFAAAARWNDRSNPVRPQPVSYPLGVIGAISTHALWSSSDATICSLDGATLKQRFKLGRLVRLTGQQQHTQRKCVSIAQKVQLGSKAAA